MSVTGPSISHIGLVSPDLTPDWPPQPQAGLGDAIHPAPEVLHNIEESGHLLFRLDTILDKDDCVCVCGGGASHDFLV